MQHEESGSCCSKLLMLFEGSADAICLIRLICGQKKGGGCFLLGGRTSRRLVLRRPACGGREIVVVDVVQGRSCCLKRDADAVRKSRLICCFFWSYEPEARITSTCLWWDNNGGLLMLFLVVHVV